MVLHIVMLTQNQIRAARSFLDWTRDDLAAATDLSTETIRRIESGATTPNDTTAKAIKKAFEAKGLEFLDQEGVRRAKSDFYSLSGREGLMRFFDDVRHVVQHSDEEIVICGVREDYLEKKLGDYVEFQRQEMAKLKKAVRMRCIIEDGDHNFAASEYCQYRWQSKETFSDVPFYVYGDKMAIIVTSGPEDPLILLINNRTISQAYRRQFDNIWAAAKEPPKRRSK